MNAARSESTRARSASSAGDPASGTYAAGVDPPSAPYVARSRPANVDVPLISALTCAASAMIVGQSGKAVAFARHALRRAVSDDAAEMNRSIVVRFAAGTALPRKNGFWPTVAFVPSIVKFASERLRTSGAVTPKVNHSVTPSSTENGVTKMRCRRSRSVVPSDALKSATPRSRMDCCIGPSTASCAGPNEVNENPAPSGSRVPSRQRSRWIVCSPPMLTRSVPRGIVTASPAMSLPNTRCASSRAPGRARSEQTASSE